LNIKLYFELTIGLINLSYELLAYKVFVFNRDSGDADILSKNMTDTIRQFRELHPEIVILGVGIGISCVVDPVNRTINRNQLFGVYSPVPFDDLFHTFKELRDISVFIENDVNASCYGELMLRKEERISDLAYLALGTGFGSGIIIDGNLRHGPTFFAGDIGNMLLSYSPGFTRQMLLESKVENHINLAAIKRLFGVDIQNDINVPLEEKRRISSYICSYLIPLIYNFHYLLDITQFIIAGVTVEFLGDILFDRIEAGMKQLLECDEMRPIIRVMPTVSKNTAIIGGAAIVFQNMLPGILNDMP